jgi:hypothetical protein
MAATVIARDSRDATGLPPWRFTLAAGLAAWLFGVSGEREPPRGKPVASLAQQTGLV